MPNIRLGVKFKLLAYTTLVIGITSSLSAYLPYQYEKQELEQRLSNELLGIVQTASIAIDMEAHENIFFDSEDGLEGQDEFDAIRGLLANVSDINQLKRHPGLSPIYTLRPVSYDESVLEFIVMTDTNKDGKYFTGAHIPRQEFHDDVLQGEARTTGIYRDSEGLWITASAPLKLSDGSVVGIVQVDRPIDFYVEKLTSLRNKFLLGAFIGVLFGLVVAYLFSRAFLIPIKILLEATKNFSLGNYDFRIKQKRLDEYGALYTSFNGMTENLSSALDDLQKNNADLEARSVELQAMALFAELNPAPVFRVDINGSVSLSNSETDKIFNLVHDDLSGTHISYYISELSQGVLSDLIRHDKQIQLLKNIDDTWFQFIVRGVSKFEFANVYGANITERVNAEKQAKIEQEKAEAASHAKSRFLATMSHELRTPMNAIVGYTNLAKKKDVNDSLSGQLGRISTASKSLLELINNILDFSKIEEGHLDIETVDFSLENIVNELYTIFSQLSREKGIDLYFHSDRALPKIVNGDPYRLKQVLINLINNAIKFTIEGAVTLKVIHTDNDDHIHFHICDTGIGIETDKAAELFDPFTQSDSSTTRKYGGTGLGLSISQRLVKLMGGEIKIDSELGVGSDFSFSIPISMNACGQAEADNPDEFSCSDVTNILIVDNYDYGRSYFLNAFNQHCYSCIFCKTDEIYNVVADAKQHCIVIYNANRNDDLLGNAEIIGDVEEWAKSTKILLFESQQEPWESQLDTVFDGKLDKPFLLAELIKIIEQPESGGVIGPDDGYVGDSWRENAKSLGGDDFGRTEREAIQIISKYYILIVEDDPVNQALDEELMEYAGAKFAIANHGQEALEMMKKENFDLILMDMQMPIMDGLTASKSIRQNPDWDHIPIIAVTANALSGDIELCMNAGMNDYVSKPIDDVILYQKMARWLEPISTQDSTEDTGADEGVNPYQNLIVDFSIVKAILGSDESLIKSLESFIASYRPIPQLKEMNPQALKNICDELDSGDLCLALPQLQSKLFEVSAALDKEEISLESIEGDINDFRYLQAHLFEAMEAEVDKMKNKKEEPNDYGVHIEGFDCQASIKRFRGSAERYMKSLKLFYDNKKGSINDVHDAINANDTDEARRAAHTIKGLAAAVGALALQKISGELEMEFVNQGASQRATLAAYRLEFESAFLKIGNFLESYTPKEK